MNEITTVLAMGEKNRIYDSFYFSKFFKKFFSKK